MSNTILLSLSEHLLCISVCKLACTLGYFLKLAILPVFGKVNLLDKSEALVMEEEKVCQKQRMGEG